jgi:membrane fusion protein, multidrug efflux system
VNVRLTLDSLHNVLTIPNAAVNHGPAQTYVYLIGPDSHVAVRLVEVGLVQDARAVIASGLQSGDEVVSDGQMALKPGSLVSIRGPVDGETTVPLAQDHLRTAPAHPSNADEHRAPATPRS